MFRRVFMIAALLLLHGATAASAAGRSVLAPPVTPVAAGAEVRTALPELPAGVREVELFLVPEAGAPIQLTRELGAGATEVRWRMPRVAGQRARLLLRAGGERFERDLALSPAFEIAPLPAREFEHLLRGESETGWRIESSGVPVSGLAHGTPRAWLTDAAASPDADECPGAPSPAAPQGPADPFPDVTRMTSPAAALAAGRDLARSIPLRN